MSIFNSFRLFFADIISLKPLSELKGKNCAGTESYLNNNVAVGVIHFEGISGRRIADLCIKDLAQNFSTTEWGTNGPGVMTRTVKKICGSDDVKSIIFRDNCQFNFRVAPMETFYNIEYYEYQKFFEEAYTDEVVDRLEESVVAHVWNTVSKTIKLNRDSKAPYVQLAKTYCPNTVAANYEF